MNQNENSDFDRISYNPLTQNTIKEPFFYCTAFGNIQGILTITSMFILFDPDIQSESNKQKINQMRIIKFQACIEYKDIDDIHLLEVPDPDR